MRRLRRGSAAGFLTALVASSAAAQFVTGAPIKKPDVTPVSVAGAPGEPLVRPPTALDAAKVAPSTNVLQNGTLTVSPLLNAPLGTTVKLTPAISGSTPQPLLQPLFGSSTGRIDLALNTVLSMAVPGGANGTALLAEMRARRIDNLVRQNPLGLDRDELGRPIVRGRLVLIGPDDRSLKKLSSGGFTLLGSVNDPLLRVRIVTLRSPPRSTTLNGMRRLRAIAPRVTADYDHIYEPAGGALVPSRGPLAPARQGSGPLIGMIDGGVATHPALAGRVIEQRGFAGPPAATGHGTAVASLLVGKQGQFRGAAAGASLLVADVYGGRTAAGSASIISRALGWLASKKPRVINISLVGPSNGLLKRSIAAVRARGIHIVAAVGNDGPTAPPQYPASYSGVVSVTGVDARGATLLESGNATHLDFAAPGADMAAARPGRGYTPVRGTSFAAPLAAGRLALVGSIERLAAEARPGKGRVGRGIVCGTCRVAPRLVGGK